MCFRKNIDKLYSAKKVLDNVDIHVPINSIYGLIGPNGAGKSTLLKCIMNLIHIDGGNITVLIILPEWGNMNSIEQDL